MLGSQGHLITGAPFPSSAHPGHLLPSVFRDGLLTWSHVVPVGSRLQCRDLGGHRHITHLGEDRQALLAKEGPRSLELGGSSSLSTP